MGCFFTACFGSCKHKDILKNDQQQNLSSSQETVKLLAAATESVKEEEIANPIKLISQSETSQNEEHMDFSNRQKAIFDHSNEDSVENENGKSDEKKVEQCKDGILTIDKECLAMKIQEVTLEDNSKENSHYVQQESSESLFSLSIDSRKHVYASEVGEKEEVNSSPLKPSDQKNPLFRPEKIVNVNLDGKEETLFGHKKNVDPNLEGKANILFGPKKFVDFLVNPLENSSLKHHEDKENLNLKGKCNGPVKKQPGPTGDQMKLIIDKEIGADCTSLSSWLAESEKSPHKTTSVGNSPGSEKNYGDRRVLGAINLKDLNECSAGPTLICSGDDQPGIGTVGGYWQQTGLNGPVTDTGLSLCSGSLFRGMSNVLTNV